MLDAFPPGHGGDGGGCPPLQQQKHVGKDDGDRKHRQNARPRRLAHLPEGGPARAVRGHFPQKLADGIELEQHDPAADDKRNGRGDEDAVSNDFYERDRQQDIGIFLRIVPQDIQETLAQQGGELAARFVPAALGAFPVLENLFQFIKKPRGLILCEAVHRIARQPAAGFGKGDGILRGEHARQHAAPVLEFIVQIHDLVAGKFKEQALPRESRQGKQHKPLAVPRFRFPTVFREDGVGLQTGRPRRDGLGAGEEDVLRAHGAGGGKHVPLPVQQGDTVRGNDAANPFQLFRLPKRVLFPIEEQPDARAGQDLLFVNASAHEQFIFEAGYDLRNLPEILIHQPQLDILAEPEDSEKHDRREEQKDRRGKGGKLFPALFPRNGFERPKYIHNPSP